MSIVKLGWSGGKDSTCAAVLHIQRGDKLKCVCYIPMFDNDIPLISPHYASNTRDGCALCYNAKKGEFEKWLKEYPEARQRLIDLQNYCKEHRPDRAPLRGKKKWFEI